MSSGLKNWLGLVVTLHFHGLQRTRHYFYAKPHCWNYWADHNGLTILFLVLATNDKRSAYSLRFPGKFVQNFNQVVLFMWLVLPLSGKTILLRIFISATKYVRDLLFRGNPNSPQPDPTRWICFSSGMPADMAIRGYRLHCSLGQMFPQLSPTRYWYFTNDRIIHSIGF